MSTFKFACPSCGQHISVEMDQAGSHMECPTCFQNIVVPQAPEEGDSKFVLTAAKVNTRVLPTIPDAGLIPAPRPGRIPYAAIAFVVVLCAALILGFVFRHKIFKPSTPEVATTDEPSGPPTKPTPTWAPPERPALPVDADENWKLDLAGAEMPTNMVSGRINGLLFTNKMAMFNGGTLSFRHGSDWPPELGISIRLYAKKGDELGGKTITIAADAPRRPEVVLRWWGNGQQPLSQVVTNGYALRLEFGPAANREISGKIYLCLQDDYKSWVAGSFTTRIKGPRPGDRAGDP